MTTTIRLSMLAFTALISTASLAQAQQSHQHQGGPAPQAQQPASPPPVQGPMGQMMQGMSEQCRTAMQMMPRDCMSMMQQMMPAGVGQNAPMATQSEATKAYLAAMDKMHGPMMEGARAADPDVAFVKGMIPHHQGAIDMAQVVLQFGKDEQTKKWAADVIREQAREISEMQEWLKKNAK